MSRTTSPVRPLVSIITPSLNMVAYIEETIASVLAQDYPNLEYIVIDAGSTDGTLSILRKYERRLRYSSQSDGGTADAINKGFAHCQGSILAFLNADDTYLPGAISTAASALSANPNVAMVYGEGYWVNGRGEIIGRYPTAPFDRKRLERECFICQPASFFRREAFQTIGGMDPKLHYSFDYDLWIRMARRFEISKIDAVLATSRMHKANKTLGHPRENLEETISLLRRHFGYVPLQWVCRYASLLVGEKNASPFQNLSPSVAAYCAALPVGMLMNRRHPMRFIGEWRRLLIDHRFVRAFSVKRPVAGLLRRRIDRMRSPKLGRLHQYPPRPLVLPPHSAAGRLASFPKISIVTPSFNHGVFIERTVRSVLDQEYPNLEYVIQDGGSSDETRSILERYSALLHHWESAADRGQAQAINRGFAHSGGEIMAWLNSDDILLPGSLRYVARFFTEHPAVEVIYGHRIVIDANDAEVGRWVMPPHQDEALRWADFIPQESLFWRRRAWDRVGSAVDESFDFAIDWDLLLRFRKSGAHFVRVPQFLAAFRVHPQQKTSAQISAVGKKEVNRIRTREHGRPVSKDEIERHLGPFMRRHLLHHGLYRLRSRFGSQH